MAVSYETDAGHGKAYLGESLRGEAGDAVATPMGGEKGHYDRHPLCKVAAYCRVRRSFSS
jgi:hypothetical protein